MYQYCKKYFWLWSVLDLVFYVKMLQILLLCIFRMPNSILLQSTNISLKSIEKRFNALRSRIEVRAQNEIILVLRGATIPRLGKECERANRPAR